MSQHYFSTVYDGKPVTVILGWDRPLQGYFLVIEDDSKADSVEEVFIYSNLLDENLTGSKLTKNLDYFTNCILKGLDIFVPVAIFQNVIADSASNIGNKVCRYHLDGGKLISSC